MRKRLAIFVLVVCGLAFVLGLAHLFMARFDVGDVYPEYSSLRTDPLGTMALCESLERMPGLVVRRDFSAANQMPHGKETTYLHLGARTTDWRTLDDEVVKEIEGFVTSGGRLAISFFPETTKPFRLFPGPEQSEQQKSETKRSNRKISSPKPAKEKGKKGNETLKSALRRSFLKERWGLELAFVQLERGTTVSFGPAVVENQTGLPLPKNLEWHTGIIFTNLPNSWQIIYSRGTNPVVIERKFASGSVVMATDSYFLSNEALRKDRQPELLSWWIGPAKHIIFDEAHFGIVESEGVAVLLRKYRLYGVVAGLILLAGLFIWKNTVSFLPFSEITQNQDPIAGREASVGFVNLLRRNIPRHEALNACFNEWKKSRSPKAATASARQVQAEALLQAYNDRPQRERDPVNTYREICGLLKKL
jgi:hypothetical protein